MKNKILICLLIAFYSIPIIHSKEVEGDKWNSLNFELGGRSAAGYSSYYDHLILNGNRKYRITANIGIGTTSFYKEKDTIDTTKNQKKLVFSPQIYSGVKLIVGKKDYYIESGISLTTIAKPKTPTIGAITSFGFLYHPSGKDYQFSIDLSTFTKFGKDNYSLKPNIGLSYGLFMQ